MLKLTVKNKLKASSKILTALLIAAVVFLIASYDIFPVADNFLSDYFYQRESVNDLPITIITIDEKTINRYGNYNDWSRELYALLLEKLYTDDSAPSVVALDVLFTGETDPIADSRLVAAAKKAGNVIVGVSAEYEGAFLSKELGAAFDPEHVSEICLPYKALADVCELGYVKNAEDKHDNYMRSLITHVNLLGTEYDSLGYKALKMYCEKQGETIPDYGSMKQRQFRFTYTGKPYTNCFNQASFSDVLDGSVDVRAFDGGIVLVGGFASSFGDDCYVPSARGTKMYGVEVHANIIEALYEGKIQTDINSTLIGVIYSVLAGILTFLLFIVSLPIGAALTLASILLQLILCRILYSNGLFAPLTLVFGAPVVIYFGFIVYQYLSERAVKSKISKAFKMYVAPQIVDEVASKGDYELSLGGRNKDIAVLFVDIRGFTTMSESLKPEEVVGILNAYFAIITDAIFKNGGTLDKFIGDAAMAVFNSPFDLDDYVYRAVHTGWDIAQGSKLLEKKLIEKFGKTVSYGVGVNCGEAVIGNIGCEFRMDYTAIGDTVNTASRLESNAKAGQILISEAVYSQIKDREGLTVEPIGEIPLKGKKVGIFVYNVTHMN